MYRRGGGGDYGNKSEKKWEKKEKEDEGKQSCDAVSGREGRARGKAGVKVKE